MICLPCRIAADNRVRQDVTRCPACDREMPLYPGSGIVVIHKVSGSTQGGPRKRCSGSQAAPLVTGHAACTGCDCQHHPAKKEWP